MNKGAQFTDRFRQYVKYDCNEIFNRYVYSELQALQLVILNQINPDTPELRDEIKQEMYLKIIEKRHKIAAANNPYAFAYITMKNICIDYLRRHNYRSEKRQNVSDLLISEAKKRGEYEVYKG